MINMNCTPRGQTAAVTIDARLLRLTIIVSLGIYVVLGLPDGVLGTVWPTLRDDAGRTDASFGLLIIGFSSGYTFASLASGHVTARLGVGRTLQLSTAMSSTGLLVIGLAPSWWTVVAGFAVLGLGNGTIDASLNAWVALTQGPRTMGLLHAAYGVGATIGPLLATAFVTGAESWRGPFLVILVLQLGAVAATTRVRRGLDEAPTHPALTDGVDPVAPPGRLLPLMIAWFAVYVAAEVTIGQWSFTLFTEGRGVSEGLAGALVAAYWGGLTAGRLVLGVFGHRIEPERVLRVTTAAALITTAALWLDVGGIGEYALPLIGVSFAVMFPLVVNRTPAYLGVDRSNQVVGYQLAAASIGVTTVPLLVGVLADRHGVRVAGPMAFGTVALLAAVLVALLHAAAQGRTVAAERAEQNRS
jgi:fucose permease